MIPWDNNEILPGAERKQEIEKHLKTADIIVLLVSPNFMAAYYASEEMQVALQRHQAKEAHLIPVILRPTDWRATALGEMQALPFNGRSVVEWRDRDQAFQDVVKGITRVVDTLYASRATRPIRYPRPMVNPKPLTSLEIKNALQRLSEWNVVPVFISGAEPNKGEELVKAFCYL